MESKEKIKQLVIDMLNYSHEQMIANVDRALKSGAIDVDSWDENDNPMILPKCIVTAILRNHSHQYEGKGTSFQKQIEKEIRNIEYYL